MGVRGHGLFLTFAVLAGALAGFFFGSAYSYNRPAMRRSLVERVSKDIDRDSPQQVSNILFLSITIYI